MTDANRRNRTSAFGAGLKFVTLWMVFVTLGTSAMAQTVKSPLVGVWKVVGWEAKTAANQVVRAYGDHPGGYYLFSKHGHFMYIIVGNNREAPTSSPPTDADVIKLYGTMSALDGTYKVEGDNKFVVHVEHSWNQSWTGTDQQRQFNISGTRLTIVFMTKNARTGEDLFVTVSSERAE